MEEMRKGIIGIIICTAKLREQTKILRIYFNNHYGGKAIVNALQFKEMSSIPVTQEDRSALQRAESYLSKMQS